MTIVITIDVPDDHPWIGEVDKRPEELCVTDELSDIVVFAVVDGDGTYSGEVE